MQIRLYLERLCRRRTFFFVSASKASNGKSENSYFQAERILQAVSVPNVTPILQLRYITVLECYFVTAARQRAGSRNRRGLKIVGVRQETAKAG